MPRSQSVIVVDDWDMTDPDGYNEEVEEELMVQDISRTFIDLTMDDATHGADGGPPRNGPLLPDEVCVEKVTYVDCNGKSQRLRPGRVLGRVPRGVFAGNVPVSYIRIQRIIQNIRTGALHVRGTPFAKNSDMETMLSWTGSKQEVTCILEVDEHDTRDTFDQAIVQVNLVPRTLSVHVLCTTNLKRTDWRPEREGPYLLSCRWFYKCIYNGTGKERKPAEYALMRATPELINNEALSEPGRCRTNPPPPLPASNQVHTTARRWPEYSCDPALLRSRWRGDTIAGGTHRPLEPHVTAHVTSARPGRVRRRRLPQQRYTLFDSFCGAGGVSRGADMAGYFVSHAVDCWDIACRTYADNFASTNLFEGTVADWVYSHGAGAVRADVVHLSPPCQYWSPAHTIAGPHDDANKAALYACNEVLRRVRPRIFTLEQTFGILHDVHRSHFNHLVRSFTDDDHSVRWRVVFLPAWGLPQRRKRLLMLGSCIGEPLPTFPPATHADPRTFPMPPGLRPFTTVREALSVKTDPADPLHRLGGKPLTRPRPAYSPDAILTRCITTHGGHNYHWSGLRQLTAREYATLQGFPPHHRFRQADGITAVKKMIGNAFASTMVKVLYEHLAKNLLRADGLDQVDVQPVACVPGQMYIDTRTRAGVVPVELIAIRDDDDRAMEEARRRAVKRQMVRRGVAGRAAIEVIDLEAAAVPRPLPPIRPDFDFTRRITETQTPPTTPSWIVLPLSSCPQVPVSLSIAPTQTPIRPSHSQRLNLAPPTPITPTSLPSVAVPAVVLVRDSPESELDHGLDNGLDHRPDPIAIITIHDCDCSSRSTATPDFADDTSEATTVSATLDGDIDMTIAPATVTMPAQSWSAACLARLVREYNAQTGVEVIDLTT